MTEEYENVLRQLIIQLIGDEDSAAYGISEDRVAKWKEKREIELKKHKGIQAENRLLYYSDFYDLKTIIFKNWELFLPILANKKRFEVFFDEVEKFRNTISHGRNLTSSQISLLSGIVADLKNLITIYHNKNETKEDYFIQLIRISDSLGNVWDKKNKPKNDPVLRVGDDYELIIEANDPKDRKISYSVKNLDKLKIVQDSNRIHLQITNELIGNSLLLFQAFTPDSDYKNSDTMSFSIDILPQ